MIPIPMQVPVNTGSVAVWRWFVTHEGLVPGALGQVIVTTDEEIVIPGMASVPAASEVWMRRLPQQGSGSSAQEMTLSMTVDAKADDGEVVLVAMDLLQQDPSPKIVDQVPVWTYGVSVSANDLVFGLTSVERAKGKGSAPIGEVAVKFDVLSQDPSTPTWYSKTKDLVSILGNELKPKSGTRLVFTQVADGQPGWPQQDWYWAGA